ncbi:transcriptional regulator ATRX homolog isoform X2 [Daphnia carinata]|uniref:transcriptional regulator ATRX homolog isoform X2 n=1 Tax=Daphnia carinata TaxID=120202 RepID=UPI0028684A30|nr:transcriptional regulator ATRX homolog isoform X2 [Daphnia carinata]
MTSSFEDFSIPDFGSADQNEEDVNEGCGLEKDSSNDANMFEDSSGEERVEATCSVDHGGIQTSTASTSKNSVADDVVGNVTPNTKALTSFRENSTFDEETLMKMTDKECDFFEKYKEANQAQLTSLKCTTCSCQLFLVNRDNIRIHPVLGVLICKSCREFYSNGPFTKDENGHDEYCRWCAEGGMMICCDTCSNVFCKACLRRCLGRANLLEITGSKCKWSCLICNNVPLWTQRALCRMVMSAIKSAPCRKSLSRRSLYGSPAVADSSDPAVWLPAIINEAEKLATYCKVLAAKVGTSWSKDEGGSGEGTSNLCDKETDKLKVISCCRKLRKAVVTTGVNMKLLEKKIVTKFEQKYGNTDDIDVELPSEASSLLRESKKPSGKRLIVKIKNFRQANSKQDYYAEVRESPPPRSTTSCSVKNSPQKSACSMSSQATIPHCPSPLSTREPSVDSDASTEVETQPIVANENRLPEVENSLTNDEPIEFFDTFSELIDGKSAETDVLQEGQKSAGEDDHKLLLGQFPAFSGEPDPNTLSPDMFSATLQNEILDLEDSAETVPLHRAMPKNEIKNDVEHVNALKQEAQTPASSPSFITANLLGENGMSHLGTPSHTGGDKKPFKSKLSRNTSSPRQAISSGFPPAANDEIVGKTKLTTANPTATSFNPNQSSSIPYLNEKARQQLLKDSTDSDDSLAELKLSPRVKRTKKRSRIPLGLEDDPKLKAECAVVVNRITILNEVLAMENVKNSAPHENTLKNDIDRIVKDPLNIAVRSSHIESDSDCERDDFGKKRDEFKKKRTKSRKDIKKSFRLADLESSSSSDSDVKADTEVAGVAEMSTASTLPNRSEAVRQALLVASDSDSDFNMDMNEIANSPIGVQEANDECDEIMPVDDNGMQEGKEEVVGLSTDGDDASKTSSVKVDKLLRMSLADPEAESDSKKSQKNKESKKEKKKITKERKKRRIQSDSDFESSESEKDKKKRKRKRSSPSDLEEISNDDENDSGKEAKSKSKSRRRIKKTAQSSDSVDSNDSDIEVLNESQRSDPGGPKGRKNIKKIMKDTNLKDETKAAAKEEEDRKKRIAERQKFYNEAFVGDQALINAQTHHLVLDFDPKTKEELVTVDKQIVTKLKPHQVKGVKFMWDACFESIERIKEHPGSGCILAHCMGLGKSLQVVTLVHTVLTNKACQVDRVLVVCPLSTVLNWVNEFKVWLPPDSNIDIYEMASAKGNNKELRVYTLRSWLEGGGVMIIGYDMYRNLTNENNKKISKKERDVFTRSLVDPGPQLVVCDEGHLLKNEKTALSKAMNKISTRRRVVLTGTPLQNSLLEYHCMIQFVKPNLLGTVREFTNRFGNPIKNGQAADSTDSDVRVMKRRAHVLHKMLEDSVQRFDYAVLTPFLPPKHEYVVSVKMSELQIKMYQYYLEHHAKGGPSHIGRGKGAGLFADFQELGRVWTHPKALLLAELNREAKAKNNSDSEGSLADFIDDRGESPESEDDGGVVCLDDSSDEKERVPTRSNGFRMRTRAARGDQPPPEDELGVTTPMSSTWWSQFVQDEDMVKMEHSGKLVLLMDILRQCELIGDKVLVFSQSLVSLNLIEEFLAAEDERNEKTRASLASTDLKQEHNGTWRLNQDYFRLDGQTSAELRKNACNAFNNPSNLRSRLFLISTKAGGLGINLVAANRVIIFDASWNPSHDVQSIFRVYRFGQKKPCYIYRFLAQGTMEEKIYDRQVTKLSLSCRVVDEQQIERHFNSADLNELYVFEPDSHLRRPTPLLPKDRLLAELTIQRKDWIVTYHEHDSLLENKSDEELTEAERKAAWDDFENEKRGVNPMGMMMQDSPGFMSMPGMPDILGGLAGRSVAGIPLSSIAAMIYNSNPGITQDEFLGRLRLTVDQLQNFSVQQAAAAAAVASAQNALQQPGDAQRLLMQRQVAADQLKRQFGNTPQGPGPSGLGASAPPRSRGRPTIGPHQRTDLYGLAPVIYNTVTGSNEPEGPSGSNSVPKT